MTVRITKPEFNLREKLSELDRPVGLHGNEILKSETPENTFNLVGTGRKNMVNNGGMTISQRYGGSSSTPSNNKHTLDQMRYDMSQSDKFAVKQVTNSPSGFSHSMRVTSAASTSPGSSDYFLLQTFIEGTNSARLGWGTSNAQTVTLSFYVKSSIAGIYACGIRNQAYDRGITQTYEIKYPDTWERKTVTFPGDTSGTWLTTTNSGLKINFDLGSGSGFEAASTGTWLGTNDFITSNSVKLLETNGAQWYITGIQLETGRVATPFEHRGFREELAQCQRYYCKSYNYETSPGTDTMIGSRWGRNYDPTDSRSANVAVVPFPTTMRATPNVTFRGIHTGTTGKWTTGSSNPNASNTDYDVNSIYDLGQNGFSSISSTNIAAETFFGGHYEAEAEMT